MSFRRIIGHTPETASGSMAGVDYKHHLRTVLYAEEGLQGEKLSSIPSTGMSFTLNLWTPMSPRAVAATAPHRPPSPRARCRHFVPPCVGQGGSMAGGGMAGLAPGARCELPEALHPFPFSHKHPFPALPRRLATTTQPLSALPPARLGQRRRPGEGRGCASEEKK